MVQKDSAVFFRDVERKRMADQRTARAPEKVSRGEVDLLDATDAVKTNIPDRRELEKIDITLNGRFQFCLWMPEAWRARRLLPRASFPYLPISRQFPGRTRRGLLAFHAHTNQFARSGASRCQNFTVAP